MLSAGNLKALSPPPPEKFTTIFSFLEPFPKTLFSWLSPHPTTKASKVVNKTYSQPKCERKEIFWLLPENHWKSMIKPPIAYKMQNFHK